MLRRNVIALLGGGLGAAALGQQKAEADQLFTSFAFPATGAPTSRTMPDRLSDVVNAKDYGATGNGVADDSAAVQAAIDASFGSAASPHGTTNASLNKPLFFPNGTYKCSSAAPTFTRVYGGHVYGAGGGATVILGPAGTPAISINGATNLIFERFTIISDNFSDGIHVDWDGTTTNYNTGGAGLNGNIFANLLIENTINGIVIASSGHDGANNLFMMVQATGSGGGAGLSLPSSSSLNNVCLLGSFSGTPAILCSGGQVHLLEMSLANSANFDLQVDSGYAISWIGGRSESANCVKLSNGIVSMRGVAQLGSPTALANVTGGRLSIDSCLSSANVVGSKATATGTITGAGLAVSSVSGVISIGQVVTWSGGPSNSLSPHIVSGSGTSWTLNYAPGNVGPIAMTMGNLLYMRCNGFLGTAGYNGTIVENI